MSFYRLILAASIAIISQQSIAGTLCAEKEGPVYQKIPDKGEVAPETTRKLISNITYKILQEKPGWVFVELGTSKYWTERKNFGTATKCGVGGKAEPVKSNRHHAEKPKHTQPSSSSGCPCGTGLVCHGPRGGRYCITSGGSKRYGV